MERKLSSWEMENEVTDPNVEHGDLFDAAWARQSRSWSGPIRELSTVHDIAVIYLEGEIGIPEFQYLSQVIRSLTLKRLHKIIFSFKAVEHLNYKVFQELMGFAKACRREAGDIRFAEISQYLYHIFLFSGADQSIDHFRDVEEALLSFHNTHGRSWH